MLNLTFQIQMTTNRNLKSTNSVESIMCSMVPTLNIAEQTVSYLRSTLVVG